MPAKLTMPLPINGLVFAMGGPLGLLRKITGLGSENKGDTKPGLAITKITLTRDYWTFIAKFELTNLQSNGAGIHVTQIFADVIDQKTHTIKTTKLFLGAPVGHLERQKDTRELRAEVSTTALVTDERIIAPGQTQEFTARLHIPDGKILLVQFAAVCKASSSGQVQTVKASACHVLGSPFEMWADEDTYSVPQASSFLNAPLEMASPQEFAGITLTDIRGKPADQGV